MCCMSVFLAFVLFAAAMACCLIMGYSMAWGLAAGLVLFFLAAIRRGFSFRAVCTMAWKGAKRAFLVMRILLLIGLITALWRSGGVIAFCAYYGVRLVTPRLFLLIAFLVSAVVSFAIGTSFGVTGTIGVIFMAIARGGGVNELMAAGAVISGAYFGDRCSPASSCANLVATITETTLYGNVRAMLRSGAIPTLLTIGGFLVLSLYNPLSTADNALLGLLTQEYALPFYVALPVVLMLALPLLKVDVRIAMASSIGASFLLTVLLQGRPVGETLLACLMGYAPQSEALTPILSGGGLISMLTVSIILLLSSSYSGIFEGTGMLSGIHEKLTKLASRAGAFPAMLLTGTASAMVFCNQTIAAILADQLMRPAYAALGKTNEERALDISDSLVMTSGLVPWSVAAMVPLSMLGVDAGALPFCLLLIFTPLCRLAGALFVQLKAKQKGKKLTAPC